jgi:large subunit ribosomal protein L24
MPKKCSKVRNKNININVCKCKFKKGDLVVIITGNNKGTSGSVLRVMPKERKIVVQGVNMHKMRKKSKTSLGGSENIEYPIDQSNALHVDPKASVPTKIGYKEIDGKMMRYSRKSSELLN